MQPIAFVLVLLGTIDRIEGGWAVVEWQPSGELHDVAMGVCPSHIREGDRIQLHAWASPDGPSMPIRSEHGARLLTPRGTIGLPSDAPLPGDQRFYAHITPIDKQPASPGRTHPPTGTREHGSMDLRLFRMGAPATHVRIRDDCTEPVDRALDTPESVPRQTPSIEGWHTPPGSH